jgi:hypothetical protein
LRSAYALADFTQAMNGCHGVILVGMKVPRDNVGKPQLSKGAELIVSFIYRRNDQGVRIDSAVSFF